MKLSLLSESSHTRTFYKGMTLENFEKFKHHSIPGFVSDLDLALVYAYTNVRDFNKPIVMISVKIDISQIVDLRDEVDDMCGGWQDNKEDPRYNQLRNMIWFADSSGHGLRGVYCGKPVPYEVLFVAHTQEEFDEFVGAVPIRSILGKYKYAHLDLDELKEDGFPPTWEDFLEDAGDV